MAEPLVTSSKVKKMKMKRTKNQALKKIIQKIKANQKAKRSAQKKNHQKRCLVSKNKHKKAPNKKLRTNLQSIHHIAEVSWNCCSMSFINRAGKKLQQVGIYTGLLYH